MLGQPPCGGIHLGSYLKGTWSRASHDPGLSPWEADHSWEDFLAGPCR